MSPFVRRWLETAGSLLPWWQRILLVLAAAFLRSAGEEVWEQVRRIDWKVEPAPSPLSDGGQASDRDLPPAQPEVTDKIADLNRGGDAG